jgi:hypothetical protein
LIVLVFLVATALVLRSRAKRGVSKSLPLSDAKGRSVKPSLSKIARYEPYIFFALTLSIGPGRSVNSILNRTFPEGSTNSAVVPTTEGTTM